MQHVNYFSYQEGTYPLGTVITREVKVNNSVRIERELFVRFFPEKNYYVVRCFGESNQPMRIQRKVYNEKYFLKGIISVEKPMQGDITLAQELEDDLSGKNSKKDISNVGLFVLMIIILAIIAVFPFAAIILVFIVFAIKDKR